MKDNRPMDRITTADVRHALSHYVDACERYGISYDGIIVLDQGSKTYGRAWRVYRTMWMGEDGKFCTGHANPPIGSDYIGATAREAYENLTTRTRTMHDMAQALSLPRHETALDRAYESLSRDLPS
jgi:hypothetical protein